MQKSMGFMSGDPGDPLDGAGLFRRLLVCQPLDVYKRQHQIGHTGKLGLGLLNVPGQRVKTLCGGVGFCSQIVIFKELVLFRCV